MPNKDISLGMPALLRCLAQRQILFARFLTLIHIIGGMIFLYCLFIWPAGGTSTTLSTSFVLSTSLPLVGLLSLSVFSKTNEDFRRIVRYSSGFVRYYFKYMWLLFLVPFALAVLASLLFTGPPPDSIVKTALFFLTSGISEIMDSGLQIFTGQIVLALMYILFVYWFTSIIVRWRAPELALVRTLVDAFEVIVESNPARWRSIALRSKAAHNIDKAASILEGPVARKFITWDGVGEAAIIYKRFLMAGAALRNKIAWLATPKADTRWFLARALADDLLVAATGDLDRLEYVDLEPTEPTTVGWFARIRATARWAVLAFGPIIFVVLIMKSNLIEDNTTKSVLVQFAILCSFVAVLSVADPTGYKDKLGSITGSGAALFGWKKAEHKD